MKRTCVHLHGMVLVYIGLFYNTEPYCSMCHCLKLRYGWLACMSIIDILQGDQTPKYYSLAITSCTQFKIGIDFQDVAILFSFSVYWITCLWIKKKFKIWFNPSSCYCVLNQQWFHNSILQGWIAIINKLIHLSIISCGCTYICVLEFLFLIYQIC